MEGPASNVALPATQSRRVPKQRAVPPVAQPLATSPATTGDGASPAAASRHSARTVAAATNPSGPKLATSVGEPQLGQWRRIALEQQLPRPRFPAGVAVPYRVVAACLAAVGLAGLLLLNVRAPVGVEHEVVSSQRRLVADLARNASSQAAATETALVEVAARLGAGADPLTVIEAAQTVVPNRHGTAIVDVTTATTVAAAGERIDASAASRLALPSTSAVAGPGGQPRLWFAVALPPGRALLVAASPYIRPLVQPAPHAQTILVGGGDTPIVNQGTGLPPSTAVLDRARALLATPGGQVVAVTMPHPSDAGEVLVLTTAPIAGLPLRILSVVSTPTAAGLSTQVAGYAALGGFGAALLVVLLVELGLVQPVRRLRRAAAAVASGQPVPRRAYPRSTEASRIAAALHAASARLRAHDARPPRGWGLPTWVPVLAASLVMVLWSVALLAGVAGTRVAVPPQIGYDTQNRTVGSARSLTYALEGGLARLKGYAGRQAAAGAGTEELAGLLGYPSFRSVYLLDQHGALVERVGREPLRGPGQVAEAAGIELDDRVVRAPAIFGHVRLADGRTVVAEFDIHRLIATLDRLDGHVTVVDHRHRTIADTGGFVAFAGVTSAVAEAAGRALRTGSTVVISGSGGAEVLLAAAPVALDPGVSQLRWAVVVQQRTSDLALAANELRSRVWLAALLGLCLAVLLVGWYASVIVRPLRTLAAAADRLVQGEFRAAISPVRQDELGAIAVCLDVCRQVGANGPDRLGGAPRNRGAANDHTRVLPRMRQPGRADPAASIPKPRTATEQED